MNPTPTVSVVIATFNAAPFIAEALDSVLAQTAQPLQVVVVDDGSSDGTPEVVAEYAARGVTLVRHERNRGVSAAINTAFTVANGEFIAMLGHDDIWLPHKLERQLELLRRSPDVDVCFTDYVEFGVDPLPGTGFGQREGALRTYPRRDLGDGMFAITSRSFLEDLVRIQSAPMPSTMLVRRSALARVIPLDEDIPAEDIQITFWLANQAVFGYVDEPLMNRRMHATNWGLTMGRLRWVGGHVKVLQRLPTRTSTTATERAAVNGLLAEYLQAAGYLAFVAGNLQAARGYYGQALRLGFRKRAFFYWLCAWLPRKLVDTLRQIKQGASSTRRSA